MGSGIPRPHEVWAGAVQRCGRHHPHDLAAFVLHRANLRIIEPLAGKLGVEHAVAAKDIVRRSSGRRAAGVGVRRSTRSLCGQLGHDLCERADPCRPHQRDVAAADDVSFQVPPGGSLAIVGESGSGKTTIARMFTGLERPTAGTITTAGHDRSRHSRRAAERRRRGRELQIVFQDPYACVAARPSKRHCGCTPGSTGEPAR
jgi:ABC-type transport system involved in cytochrome bd biosynthesis fused ATPase/permease subunit